MNSSIITTTRRGTMAYSYIRTRTLWTGRKISTWQQPQNAAAGSKAPNSSKHWCHVAWLTINLSKRYLTTIEKSTMCKSCTSTIWKSQISKVTLERASSQMKHRDLQKLRFLCRLELSRLTKSNMIRKIKSFSRTSELWTRFREGKFWEVITRLIRPLLHSFNEWHD